MSFHPCILKCLFHSLKGSSFCVLGSWPLHSQTTLVTTVILTNIFHLKTPVCMVYIQILSSSALQSPQTASSKLCWNCSHRTPAEERGQLRAKKRRYEGRKKQLIKE